MHSYVIEIKPGQTTNAHRSMLKPYVVENEGEETIPMFYHRRTVPFPESGPDMWRTERILDHRLNRDGIMEFLTKWQGFDETTWEPIGHFFHEYSADLIAYCQEKNLGLNITHGLSSTPH